MSRDLNSCPGAVMSKFNEAQAIAQLKQGDIHGLEYLVRQHQVEAVRTATLITQDHDLAKDIVQTAFVRVYEHIHQFDSTRSFAPWFFRIVANDALKAMTKGKRLESLDMTDDAIENTFMKLLGDNANQPEQAIEAAEFEQVIKEALASLPPDQRSATVLYYYLDMGLREIADTHDTSVGTIKWRLHAARQQLKRLLGGWFFGSQSPVQEDSA